MVRLAYKQRCFHLDYIGGCGLGSITLICKDSVEGLCRWDESDTSKNFYMIPNDKRNVKVLHGEKRDSEYELIIDYLKKLKF